MSFMDDFDDFIGNDEDVESNMDKDMQEAFVHTVGGVIGMLSNRFLEEDEDFQRGFVEMIVDSAYKIKEKILEKNGDNVKSVSANIVIAAKTENGITKPLVIKDFFLLSMIDVLDRDEVVEKLLESIHDPNQLRQMRSNLNLDLDTGEPNFSEEEIDENGLSNFLERDGFNYKDVIFTTYILSNLGNIGRNKELVESINENCEANFDVFLDGGPFDKYKPKITMGAILESTTTLSMLNAMLSCDGEASKIYVKHGYDKLMEYEASIVHEISNRVISYFQEEQITPDVALIALSIFLKELTNELTDDKGFFNLIMDYDNPISQAILERGGESAHDKLDAILHRCVDYLLMEKSVNEYHGDNNKLREKVEEFEFNPIKTLINILSEARDDAYQAVEDEIDELMKEDSDTEEQKETIRPSIVTEEHNEQPKSSLEKMKENAEKRNSKKKDFRTLLMDD